MLIGWGTSQKRSWVFSFFVCKKVVCAERDSNDIIVIIKISYNKILVIIKLVLPPLQNWQIIDLESSRQL